jgi:pilus assembly protein Flp/PilA
MASQRTANQTSIGAMRMKNKEMKKMTSWLKSLWKDEDGPTAVEYALMVTLIAVAIIVGATALGTATNNRFNNTATTVNG